jgi:cystathionine beta-lyase
VVIILTANHFDTKINRHQSGSVKWDDADFLFGAEGVLPLWVADTDFLAPAPVLEAIQKRAAHGVFGYPSPRHQGFKALQGWLKKRHNWEPDEAWMVSTPGVVTALSVAIQTFTQPGDKIIIQPPVYPPFFSSVQRNGRQIIENPLINEGGNYRIDFDDLARKAKDAKLLIFCNPHNPVGRVWSKEELKELTAICLQNNLLIVSDEIHSDLILQEHRHIPLSSLSQELAARIITCMAPSKTFNTAGLYTSTVIISDAEVRKQFTDSVQTLGIAKNNVFGIAAQEAAYLYGEPWLEQLLVYLEGNADFLTGFVAEKLPKIKIKKPEGTYLAWLDCRELGLTADQLGSFFANEAKVGLNNGATFGQQGEGFMRLNFGCSREVLREALERIEQAYKKERF